MEGPLGESPLSEIGGARKGGDTNREGNLQNKNWSREPSSRGVEATQTSTRSI